MSQSKAKSLSTYDKVIDFGKQLFAGVLRSRTGALTELSKLLRFQTGTRGYQRMYDKLLPLIEELKAAFLQCVRDTLPAEGPRLGLFDDSSIKKEGGQFPKQQTHHDHSDNSFYSGMKVLSSMVYQNGKVATVSSRLVGKQDNKLTVAKQDINLLIEEFLVDIFLFDSWYCKDPVIEHIIQQDKLFVSRARRDSKVLLDGESVRIDELAKGMTHNEYTRIKINGKSYWVQDLVLHFDAYGELRVIISKDGVHKKSIFLVTNAQNFSAQYVVKLYLKRFAIEVFFKDAKQFLNLETFLCRSAEKWDLHLLSVGVLHWAIQKRNSISKTVRLIREDIDQCLLFINQNPLVQRLFDLLRENSGVLGKGV